MIQLSTLSTLPLITTLITFSQSLTIYNEVATFCDQNGMRFLTISSFDSDVDNAISKMFESTKNSNIRARSLTNSKLDSTMEFHLDDFLAISSGPKLATEFHNALESIKSRKIKKSLLLIPSQVDEERMMKKLQELKGNAFFYLAYPGSTKTKFKQVISLSDNDQTIISDIEFNQFGFIIEDYNLQGVHLVSNTLSWAPWFVLEDCNVLGQVCKSSGFYADYMDALGVMFNFTWESYKQPDDKWGPTPTDGIYNRSGTWGGVFGSIIHGDYHVSLSQWIWNYDRYGLIDYVATTTDSTAVVLTPSAPEIDIGLFIRPFKNDAWIGAIIVIAITLIGIMVPYAYLSYYEYTDGYKISTTSIWIFFLLMNAYYGGAMTMFFTNEVTIPFETIEDVLRAYPNFNLMMETGNDVHFNRKALYVSIKIFILFHQMMSPSMPFQDPLYAEFWSRVQDDPEKTVYKNIEEGLSTIQNVENVIHVSYEILLGYFRSNPFAYHKIKVFDKKKGNYNGLIVPLNSPLKPILQKGAVNLIETGALDHLVKSWVGRGLPVNKESEKMVLSAGQVFLVFGIMLLTIGTVCCILLCEVVTKNWIEGWNIQSKIFKTDISNLSITY